ncbi:MAG: DUF983 domain-containing protein, partial [Paracoccaceae bacterium]
MIPMDSDFGPDRPVKPAIKRGFRQRCPACGEGRLLTGYLTVRDACPSCGEPFHHHRADDGPAYLTILIVGHIMAPLLLWSYSSFRPSPATIILIFGSGCILLS